MRSIVLVALGLVVGTLVAQTRISTQQINNLPTTSYGLGIVATTMANDTTVSVDTVVTGIRVNPPPTSTSFCSTGFWATDSQFYYSCVSPNIWRRAALQSF